MSIFPAVLTRKLRVSPSRMNDDYLENLKGAVLKMYCIMFYLWYNSVCSILRVYNDKSPIKSAGTIASNSKKRVITDLTKTSGSKTGEKCTEVCNV